MSAPVRAAVWEVYERWWWCCLACAGGVLNECTAHAEAIDAATAHVHDHRQSEETP